jgi:acyl dehydratase
MSAGWDDLAEGTTRGPREYGPITRTDIVRYAGASGDFNPIHRDEHYAQAAGFPTVFAPGMFQAGVLSSFATDWLGPTNLRRFAVQFREQVWPGDVLVCRGAVASRCEREGVRTVDLELVASRAGSDRPAVVAEATFVVP